ncbi:uncharacterized protein [Amphiura filiformis]|uniref:uncharacterized protein n=1 Tax=Amphiura filiformis TaxID=82378 RepID=UPI003B21A4EB
MGVHCIQSPKTYTENLEATCTKYLKRWAGISRCTTNIALYRSKGKHGLQVKKLTTAVKCMQVIKYHLNRYSRDGKTQTLYRDCLENKKPRRGGIELKSSSRNSANGFKKTRKLIKDMGQKEHRKCLTNLVKEVNEEDMLVYLYGCPKQGQWLKLDSAMQTDTSWKKLLYAWTPELLSFRIHDHLPSPANLKLLGKINLGLSQLCNYRFFTLLHILNCCSYSLENGRYNWRQDQTLRTIASGLAPYIDEATNSKTAEYIPDLFPTIACRTADGTTYMNPALRTPKTKKKTSRRSQ